MESVEIAKYVDMALRRRYWIIVCLLVTLLAGLFYALITPKMYKGETLILVVPQRVPDNYVQSIVSENIEERLQTIQQQVTSRTNLEEIIDEYQLFKDLSEQDVSVQEQVERFRKRIEISVSRGSAFSISFQYEDPRKAMEITNRLASNFIAENLKIRESQAIGTSEFLGDEVEAIERRLQERENALKEYRESYMGGLPEQLDTNLNLLERLQVQLDQLKSNLREEEDRKAVVQTQIAEQAASGTIAVSTAGPQGQGTRDIQSLRNELASLEAKYTSKHPDVVRLKETVASLEREIAQRTTTLTSDNDQVLPVRVDPVLASQLQNIDLEISGLRVEIEKTEAQIAWYQKKVEETPQREQELISLNRDYDNVNELYSSLLGRKLEAEIAVSLEKKQKGEQFRVIDPAKLPERPIRPDFRIVVFAAIVLGLGLGGGMAYLLEMMDTSFKTPEEVEQELQVPVLVSTPFVYTENELKNQRKREILKAAYLVGGFVLSAVGIILSVKGVDKTLEYFRDFFGII